MPPDQDAISTHIRYVLDFYYIGKEQKNGYRSLIDSASLGMIIDDISKRAQYEGTLVTDLPQIRSNQTLIESLRGILTERKNSYASRESANLLLACGFDDEAVLSAACPWKSLFFRWNRLDLTSYDIDLALAPLSFKRDVSNDLRSAIDGWIRNPHKAAWESVYNELGFKMLSFIFGKSVFSEALETEIRFPDEVMMKFLKASSLGNEITRIMTSEYHDWRHGAEASASFLDWSEGETTGQVLDHSAAGEAHSRLKELDHKAWNDKYESGEITISFTHKDVEYVFFAGYLESRINDKFLMINFDGLMELIGSNERIFRINIFYDHWGLDGGEYVIAPPDKFIAIMKKLYIPYFDSASMPASNFDVEEYVPSIHSLP